MTFGVKSLRVRRSGRSPIIVRPMDSLPVQGCCSITKRRSGPRFVTHRIIRGAMDVAAGKVDSLNLGALGLARDWGWAPEYVEAMHQMLERDTPEDFIIATGETNTLEDFVATAFSCFGRDWRDHVILNPTLLRPFDITFFSGDPSKADRLLGWKASKKCATSCPSWSRRNTCAAPQPRRKGRVPMPSRSARRGTRRIRPTPTCAVSASTMA
jgi:hypothetical protein